MNKLNIGLIFGGESSEHEVSCASAASIIRNIDNQKYDVTKIWIDKNGVWYVYEGPVEYIDNAQLANKPSDAKFIPAVLSPCSITGGLFILDKKNSSYSVLKLDCIIPIIHGTTGEDGVLQGILELSHIPYVGCRTASSAVCMDKAITKVILDSKNVVQADWLIFYKSELESDMENVLDKTCTKFEFPIFVKPANTGSSVGVSKAYNREELREAFTKAAMYDVKIIAEEFIDGREIELAILETEKDGSYELMVSECGEVKPGSDFYDYDDKYKNGVSSTVIPADIPHDISEKLKKTAVEIFRFLECRGFSRCDFFLRGEQIVFNEVNTLPGFTKISMYPQLMSAVGVGYTELITRLIEFAMKQKH
ncbi:MAG: D-alanine--D-alanine ligase [Ruminococcaceae bacterium]|nr:D-alanine--D-alanine ligase [Oscillospiraceae bacterium]